MKILSLSFLLCLSLSAIIHAQAKKTLAVLELNAEGISDSEVRIISDRIRALLFDSGNFSVIEREKMNSVLQEQGFQQSGCVSDECAVEIGQLIGVQQMVAGSIGKIGNLYTINVRIIDVQSGKVIKTAYEDCGCPIEDVLKLSTSKIVNILIDKNIVSPKTTISETSEPNLSKIYFSAFLGYGTSDPQKLGLGTKIGYITATGLFFGAHYFQHFGTSIDTDEEYTDAWQYFIGGEFGYKMSRKNIYFLPSLMIGYYNYFDSYGNNLTGEEYEIDEGGITIGLNFSIGYKVLDNLVTAVDLKYVPSFDGDGEGSVFLPYASFNFLF